MDALMELINNNVGSIGAIVTLIFVMVLIYMVFEARMEQVMHEKAKDKIKGGLIRNMTGSSFEDQLVEALLMISSSLKAGRNLDQAFELVAVSTPPPMCTEFQQVVQERRLGVPMVEALTNLMRRVPSQDLRLAINATIFQQETGGNLEDLYRQIVSMVSERKKILGKVRAGCAHAKLSGNMVGMVPIFFCIMMVYFQPTYLKPMLDDARGCFALVLSVLAAIVGLVFINKMTSSVLPEAEESSLAHLDVRRRENRWHLFRPLLRALASINARFTGAIWDRYRAEIQYHLDVAGNPAALSPDEFIAVKEVFALIVMCLVIIFLKPFSYGLTGILMLIVLSGIGFHVPKVYLTRRTRIRQENIEYELPYMIDLLSLAIEAGLDLVGGIQKIVEKSRPTDIIVEFQIFLADLKLGKSLEEALSDMADRVQFLTFFAFVSSLIQAQRLGADIGPTLRAQAEQMRFQRLIQAEERMNRLPVLLLIPLVFFIFPSIFVLVMGPSFMKVMNEWGNVAPPAAIEQPATAQPAPLISTPRQIVPIEQSEVAPGAKRTATPTPVAPATTQAPAPQPAPVPAPVPAPMPAPVPAPAPVMPAPQPAVQPAPVQPVAPVAPAPAIVVPPPAPAPVPAPAPAPAAEATPKPAPTAPAPQVNPVTP